MLSPHDLIEEIDAMKTAWMKLARNMPLPLGEWPAYWRMTPEFTADLRRFAWADGDFIQPSRMDQSSLRVLGVSLDPRPLEDGRNWALIDASLGEKA